MKVLLVAAPLGRKEVPIYPLGLSYLAGALEGKHDVIVLDPNVLTRDEFVGRTRDYDADIVGISLRNIDSSHSFDHHCYFDHFPIFVTELAALTPRSTIVVGGSGFSIYPGEVMKRCPEINFGVLLEAEEIFPKLIEKIDTPELVQGVYFRRENELIFTGPAALPDFSRIGIPPRTEDLGPYQKYAYQLGIQTKRGCALRCIYCNYPYLNGKRVRLRDPQSVVDELENLNNDYSVKRFFFSDGTFNEPQDHAVSICKEMVLRGLNMSWGAYFSMRDFDDNFKTLCTEAGCELFDFAPDGLRQETMTALRKGYRENKVYQIIDLFRESDYPGFGLSLMFNVPKASLKDIFFVLRALTLWKIRYPSLRYVSVTNMRIYPFTPLQEIAIREGIIKKDDTLFDKVVYDPWPLRPLSAVLDFSRRTLRSIRKLTGVSQRTN